MPSEVIVKSLGLIWVDHITMYCFLITLSLVLAYVSFILHNPYLVHVNI